MSMVSSRNPLRPQLLSIRAVKISYKCLFNHELLFLFTSQTPYQCYAENVGNEQVEGCVRELGDTGVDALMICPQAWMTNLWPSEVDLHWQTRARREMEPLPEQDWKYYEKAYYRARRYLIAGNDPVALSVAAARSAGIAPFLSYRMNEAHYSATVDCPTHSHFWRNHPEYWIAGRRTLNYLEPEVREYFLSLIFELLDRYEIDGFECDFMRYPECLPKDQIPEGTKVITEFIRAIRGKMDEVGERRQRRLPLCVRVPSSPERALAFGLDVARWVEEGWVQMINATTSFRLSPQVDVEGYRRIAPNAKIYPELHFVTQGGSAPGGFTNNINRKTTAAIYRSTALGFLERGADGISLFNFSYTRDHSFNEPRRKMYPGQEPPFAAIRSLTNPQRLKTGPQHFVFPLNIERPSCPIRDGGHEEIDFHLPNCLGSQHAILRLEANESISQLPPFSVSLNGSTLPEMTFHGELFPPLSLEAIPEPPRLRHYRIPLDALRAGKNLLVVDFPLSGYNWGSWGNLILQQVEIALYENNL
jgi:hypothetical protein